MKLDPLKTRNRKVITYGHDGKINGWLMELYKEGSKTVAYLTAAKPGAFKGYHLHTVREARYVCIRGKVKVTLYSHNGKSWQKEEYILEEQDALFIPKNVATGIENIGKEEVCIVNYPNPAYDPDLKGEQIEYTQQELERGVIK